ncbi:MAG TPA: DUF2203 domain-containing protein [Bryobacteraceae bacterium]|nr:DUF2203 domain-containing protein [Bryobacteraceae bacterium]
MTRFFTLRQAEQLLPEVEAAIREALAARAEYQEAESANREFQRRVMLEGGMRVDHGKLLERKHRREMSAQHLKQAVERIHGYGCLVKDLDTGLIDFPTLFNGEEVYLCWRLGEPAIQFWHGVQEGFRGRKAIDQEFLDHHQGDLPN